MSSLSTVFTQRKYLLKEPRLSDEDRRVVIDELGRAFEKYRTVQHEDYSYTTVPLSNCVEFCRTAIAWLDHCIAANSRPDGLRHGYNLIRFEKNGASITHLPEMLEGQVATLASGVLTSSESADLLENLFDSNLYRADHDTFLLYPEKHIPSIMDKGIIDTNHCSKNPIITRALKLMDSRLVEQDERGRVRFNSAFKNRRDLESLLITLSGEAQYKEIIADHTQETIELYESIFEHHSFTGRSGGMYGYEGIGCTYWHMVAKLLVAAGECFIEADSTGESQEVIQRLAKVYHRIRDGLGFRRTAQQFGGIAIDAYSHTPAQRGAQQPGMTGQVKEELITRRMELGVSFQEGTIQFNPRLLAAEEWLPSPTVWSLPNEHSGRTELTLDADSLGFQCWGIPVVYRRVDGPANIHLISNEGTHTVEGHIIDEDTSMNICSHHSPYIRIDVDVPHDRVCLA